MLVCVLLSLAYISLQGPLLMSKPLKFKSLAELFILNESKSRAYILTCSRNVHSCRESERDFKDICTLSPRYIDV